MLTMNPVVDVDLRAIARQRRTLDHLGRLFNLRSDAIDCPRGATHEEFERWCRFERPIYERLRKRASRCFAQARKLAVSGMIVPPRPTRGRRWKQQVEYIETELHKLYALPSWEARKHYRKRMRLEYRFYLALWIRRFRYQRVLSALGKTLGHTELCLHMRMADVTVLKAWKDPSCSYGYVFTLGRGFTHGCFYEHTDSISLS